MRSAYRAALMPARHSPSAAVASAASQPSTSRVPSSKNLRYEKTRAAPAFEGTLARQLVVVLGHGDDRQARGVTRSMAATPSKRRAARSTTAPLMVRLVAELVGLEGDGQLLLAAQPHGTAAGAADGLGDARRPHQVVGKDDDGCGQETSQVSLGKSRSRSTPSPLSARTSSICPATS